MGEEMPDGRAGRAKGRRQAKNTLFDGDQKFESHCGWPSFSRAGGAIGLTSDGAITVDTLAAGADGITAHLREDRRHITDADIALLGERRGEKW